MRSRIVKPEFFYNERLGKMEPLAQLLFVGLWCLADREGRLKDRPERIRAEVFPYRVEVDVNSLLEILGSGIDPFIYRYETEGVGIIQICNFVKHQKVHNHEATSSLPGPTCSDMSLHGPTKKDTLTCSVSRGRGKGIKEGGVGETKKGDVAACSDMSRQGDATKKEEAAPLWGNYKFLRLSERDVQMVKLNYSSRKYPPQLFEAACEELEHWLSGDTPGALRARRSKTHHRQFYAVWLLEKAQSRLKLSKAGVGNVGGVRRTVAEQRVEQKRMLDDIISGGDDDSGRDGEVVEVDFEHVA